MEPRELVTDLVKAGWTQAEIGARVGIFQASVSKIFRGQVPDVMSTTYRKLSALHAEVLGTGVAIHSPVKQPSDEH